MVLVSRGAEMENSNFFNLMSERLVLGCLINNPNWINLTDGLKVEYFYAPSHKIIYKIIYKLVREEKADVIDGVSIYAYAGKNTAMKDILDNVGGLEYLINLANISEEYSKQDFDIQANIVIKASYYREQYKQKENFLKTLQTNSNLDIADINNILNKEQADLQLEYSATNDFCILGNMIDGIWAEMEENAKGGVVGLPSKLPLLNEYTTYRKGELVVVGGRPKGGKSVFGLNEAHHKAVKLGIPTLYIDTEMQTTTFFVRMLALESQVPIREIETMSYKSNPIKVNRIEKAKEVLKKAPLIHKYSYSWKKEELRDILASLKNKFDIQFVIYDYIKVKEAGDGNIQEHNELGNWTILLKDLAGEFEIPILTMAQMSPHEIRLADSDKINRYASTICYILQMNDKNFNEAQQVRVADIPDCSEDVRDFIYVDYNRNGQGMIGKDKGINIVFDRPRSTIKQAKFQFPEIANVEV